MIEGPARSVNRQVISYSRLALTDFTVNISRSAGQKDLTDAWAEGDIQSKWDASSWAKKLAKQQKRAKLSDFDRFKVMVARKQRSAIIAKKLKELK